MTTENLTEFVRKNLLSVVCGVLSLAFAITLYLRSDSVTEADKLLEEKTAEGERLQSNIKSAWGEHLQGNINDSELNDQYKELTKSNKAIEERLVKFSQLAENLQYFYRLESDTHTKLGDLHQTATLPRTKAGSLYIPVDFSLSVEGDYLSVIDFLRRLENGQHFARIDSCSFRPTSSATRGGPLTVSMNLQILGQP